MYDKVIKAITKRANHKGWAYVEDYGASLHKTANVSMDETVETIDLLERLGYAEVVRTTRNFPVAVKLVKKAQDIEREVATVRYNLVSVLNQATSTHTDVVVSQ